MKTTLVLPLLILLTTSVIAQVYVLPFQYTESGHIFMEAEIVNTGKKGIFVFDTGGKNVLNERVFTGKENTFDIKLGNLVISNQSFVKHDYTKVFTTPDLQKLYGMLGPDIAKEYIWQVDYRKQLIVVTKKLAELSPSTLVAKSPLIIKRKFGLTSIQLQLKTETLPGWWFTIDTGSPEK
ncbi:hypothetical protein [Chryseosolibacter indicus]|uniref:Uncharacterized protein n=1 Tax=Chryseosolibacter indicus TaxID=2782351 RepID=A0ABS5VQV5_9BACT|nr:hypothetical protein [Chryseosolibacter indicus]MBT1703388.1 hypothetical protein [Chryseosolibacter indicus]